MSAPRGARNDGREGREALLVSRVQLPLTALLVSTMEMKFAGGVRNGGEGKTGAGACARTGASVAGVGLGVKIEEDFDDDGRGGDGFVSGIVA